MEARMITVEVNVCAGLHYFIVGLADGAVRESLRRVESALKSNEWHMPRIKVVVNLAPAGFRKSGTAFDLPIALGVLGASEQLETHFRLSDYAMMGELALDGSVRPIQGALLIAEQTARTGLKGLIVPAENASEAALAEGLPIYGVGHIREVIDVLQCGEGSRYRVRAPVAPAATVATRASAAPMLAASGRATGRPPGWHRAVAPGAPDFSHVRGQAHAKRALEIAAAGSHNVLFVGPPGTGKTMLAQLLPGILPPLTREEAIEVTRVHSVAGKLPPGASLMTQRPFRSPHHSASAVSLVGGGTPPSPGEISLAHHGVLFLDELPEFPRMALEFLRQPLEERVIHLSRVGGSLDFPASFMLLAAMNPCPCGYHTHPVKPCTCPDTLIRRYWQRVSGPLLDRIDLQVGVGPMGLEDLVGVGPTGLEDLAGLGPMGLEDLAGAGGDSRASGGRADARAFATEETSETVRARVCAARAIQVQRFAAYTGIFGNAHMNPAQVQHYCVLPPEASRLLRSAVQRLQLSARACDRVRKIARTIADLDGEGVLKPEHIAEALQYRSLDRDGTL
jgi:magnesium chelatase family protein